MAGIVGMLATIGEHMPILRKDKILEPTTEGEILKLHFRTTCLIILIMSLMVTSTEWISGTDSIINCLHQGSIPENVINSYCYIMGTFSVPKHYVDYDSQIGYNVAETGVGPYKPGDDYIEVKAYYQWVPFVLFFQGIMFYAPHLIFKAFEGGKVKLILAGLHQWVLDGEERTSKEEELANYIIETRGLHVEWTVKITLAHFLYLFNVIGQILFTDMFLGYEFSKYGISAASLLEQKPEDRTDPMSRVFPRMTKCTFMKYGSTGTIQRHDAQCILPINIINEKIYVFLWFWFCILTILTILDLLWNFAILLPTRVRKIIFRRKLALSPKRDELDVDIDLIIDNLDFGDWKLIYHLLRNMDSMVFGEFCEHLTDAMREEQKRVLCGDDPECLLHIGDERRKKKKMKPPKTTEDGKKLIVPPANEFQELKNLLANSPQRDPERNPGGGNYLQKNQGQKAHKDHRRKKPGLGVKVFSKMLDSFL